MPDPRSIPAELIASQRIGRFVYAGETSVSGTSANIDEFMMGQGYKAGGTEIVPGLVTSGANNFVYPFKDRSRIYEQGKPVYGRLTIEGETISGDVTFEARSRSVIGAGTHFTSYGPGQLIKPTGGPEHHWSEIESVEDDEHLTLSGAYYGPNSTGEGEVGDWILSFYRYDTEEIAVSVTGTIQVHLLKSEHVLSHTFFDSVLDPRYELYVGGSGTLRREVFDNIDFTYDEGSDSSSIELAYSPLIDDGSISSIEVYVNGVLDTAYVTEAPVWDKDREYMIAGNVLSIAGDLSETGEGTFRVIVKYLS